MIGWIGLIFVFIIAVSCCCASDSKSSGSASSNRTSRSTNTYNRGNAHYNRISYSECPSCGAPYYDGYCEECGYPNVNQGWLGENY